MGFDSESDKLQDGPTMEHLKIEEVVDRIVTKTSPNLIVVFLSAALFGLVAAPQTYIPVFTGFIPYSEWECLPNSTRCISHFSTFEKASIKALCDNDFNFKDGIDFKWTTERTSFAVDWGFYCSTESKQKMVSSFFFIGGFIGLLCATNLFDKIGRKKGALIGGIISVIATLAGTFVNSYGVMLVVRIVQGFGRMICWTGIYCWILEFSPGRLRNIYNASILMVWGSGYSVIVLSSYLITDWNYIWLCLGILSLVSLIPFLVYPESPRFELIKGREKEAKKTLEAFSRVNKNFIPLDNITLINEDRSQTFIEQIKDFRKAPVMLRETLLLIFVWFVCAALFYGFNFGWTKISSNLYSSYLFAWIGEMSSYILMIPITAYFGRKNGMIFLLGSSIIFFGIAMPDLQIYGDWDLQRIACLLGTMCVSAAFALSYLYAGELAPTTHRGMVLSLCSSSARVGSFIGPYISLLYNVTDRRVPLVMFSVGSALACLATMFLADSTGRSIPETPQEREDRASKEGLPNPAEFFKGVLKSCKRETPQSQEL